MKKENLYIMEIKKFFINHKFFRKSDLRNFYRNQYKELEEKKFRRILYSLEKNKIIIAVDSGIYVLSNKESLQSRKKFIPSFSPEIRSISDSIQTAFPYTKNLIWETRILYDFMLHQPGQNLTVLETEKETVESVFNFLENQFVGKVFLDPSQEIVEKYVFRIAESIIVSPMISRSPHQKVNGIPCPKLEKILVDVFVDKELFFIFQGQELVNIYKTAFRNYQISEKTLFSYAERRKVHQKIRVFITQKTDIQLIQQEEAN